MFYQQLTNTVLATILGISAIAFQAENAVAEPNLETASNCEVCADSDGNFCCPQVR